MNNINQIVNSYECENAQPLVNVQPDDVSECFKILTNQLNKDDDYSSPTSLAQLNEKVSNSYGVDHERKSSLGSLGMEI